MKMTTMLLALSLSTAAFAQKGVEDGSRFGHGQDSLNCLKNISVYTEYVKTNNFKDAYPSWKAVFDEAPWAQVATYTNGAKILRALIAAEKDGAKQKEYFNLLMKVHDQRIQYLDGLNRLVKSPTTKGDILGAKAHDYFSMGGQDNNEAYAMFAEAVAAEKQNLPYYVLMEFVDASARKVKAEEAHKEQFVQDYIAASGYANEAFNAAKKESAKKNYQTAKDNIEAFFINSGAAECDQLEAIYAPKVEENKENLEYLRKVVAVMGMLDCTESETYYNASEYAHHIAPTAATAAGCAYRYLKRGDMAKSLEYFDQAMQDYKGELCYNGGLVTADGVAAFGESHPSVDKVMIGMGLLANPALCAQCKGMGGLERNALRGFHDELYHGYLEAFKSERNTIFHMKELWQFMLRSFDGGEKLFKQIKKAENSAKYEDAVALYGKYIGNWGGEATKWRLDAETDGEVVASVTYCPSAKLHLEVTPSHTELREGDTYDMAAVRIRILDEYGNPSPYAQLPVQLALEGPAELVGPAVVTAEGGMTGTYVRTLGKTGEARLTITTDRTEPVVLIFKIAVV